MAERNKSGQQGSRQQSDDPVGLFARSQEQALRVASETLNRVRAVATAGGNAPDELLKQVAELSSAVTGLAGSATGLAGVVAEPMHDFIVQQRKLAETIAKFAEAQSELSLIVAEFAQRQAETVAALEKVTTPMFGLIGVKTDESRSR
ncbi:hypothetical protein [Gordonia phthalatica]|uniref:Uncharacterized protein n=1 Tax=Gordonia phthalatica TaxID=1136941 RepID=A0A0N7FV65_9ACTN|nr:hypothetical protein [Gordonia phthalatica]ALG86295.1 hypothetical protein ACH46_19630 [Gordonia phthalatica]